MDIFINGRQVQVNGKVIGKGGEADIYDLGHGQALKIFKPPEHPDFLTDLEREGARLRIMEHQQKLPSFPKNLPKKVIAPLEIATDGRGKIIGYTMQFVHGAELLLRYGEKNFRQAGIPNEAVNNIFTDLYGVVSFLHQANIVIGDFNNLNVLVKGSEISIIDTDSFQFGRFLCKMFTLKFLDPKLSSPDQLVLTRPYKSESDWYAFAIMLMESLLFTGPYGGIYIPKDRSKQVPQDKRPLKRITVFNTEVRYPKPAVHYKVLPDDLLHYFFEVFEKDLREKFPVALIQNLQWIKCEQCGTEHARNICPVCVQKAPAAIKSVTVIRGKVSATRFFKTSGQIIFATVQNNKLQWLYHENREFKREDGQVVTCGNLNPSMRFRIQTASTLIAQNDKLLIFSLERNPETLAVDCYGNLPIFDANETSRYWIYGGQLLRNGRYGHEYVGDVLQGQTLFWTGPSFGFGFYRAGNISVAFIFNEGVRGINDDIKITFRGQIIDSTCFFTKHYVWFLVSIQYQGRTVNRCYLITEKGGVLAEAEGEHGDETWLGNIRGKCAVGNFFLSATDAGIERIEIDNGKLVKVREFPDTEPFINSGSHLFAGNDGLYVVDGKTISVLKIN
ncbi:MAG: hypothetical protein V1655_02210 [bacterium]